MTSPAAPSPGAEAPAATPAPPAGAAGATPAPTSTPQPPGTLAVPPWRRYVALGDSMTEGLWDVDPVGQGPRGWADLLAQRLAERRAAAGAGPVEYANLAVRGRLLGEIVQEQLPAALAHAPDLISLVGGGNDLLRPGADPDVLAARLERAVRQVRAAGCDVLLATGMDTRATALRTTRSRVAVFNAHVWSVARRHGAHVVDVWGLRALQDWRMWAPDRIHLTTAGHERVTQAALVALGLGADDPAWEDPLTPLPPVARTARWRGDLGWVRQYAGPWAVRRLRGRSSGDARQPKRPEPGAVILVQEPRA
ncbi:SGNH/GDSL hydrolase family protein [Georgenia yuyongxinii]|uniref:SGNH/GDSL hydrolase family protein n=1 Tax=Georgenia yuyongxinii TaxID=2589797 RepID=A0A552WRM5_9MICO|nr:SGNH/GDSL hydrolase family protein [Georgenia yuyongxinii]TRW45385.1 SGNH/GDSL hydrolase family protein [Georgenia yuyongxinii]